jgi:sialate O-acetylesterase
MKLILKGSSEKVSIAGEWKYLPVAEFKSDKFYVFGEEDQTFYKRPQLKVQLSAYTPSVLYNGMINPLVPFTIKGAIWYQGESNTGDPDAYKELFPAMISNWRNDWGLGDFPFYYVQIAPYNYGGETNSQRLREAQLVSLSTPNVGMAVTMDIANPINIHPGKKKEVGERLAFWALAKDYNQDVVYSGPIFKSIRTENGKAVLTFDFSESGLLVTPINGKNNFTIAGKDQKFLPANVQVQGRELVVFNPKISEPVAVRYSWSDTDEGTLFNKDGLPASSFRTDNWK